MLQLDWTPVDTHKKNNLPANQNGCDKSEATYKRSQQEESISALSIFVNFMIGLFFQNNFPNNIRTKMNKAELHSPR